MHKLIERQIRLFLGEIDLQKIPREWMTFLRAVSDTYTHADQDRELSLRSLELSSAEFAKLNEQLSREKEIIEQKVDEQTKEIKRAYEVEKKARLELEELSKIKDQFVLATQHHLRTPLTIVKGYIDSLYKDVSSGKVDRMTLEYINKAGLAADRLNHLVNELLSVSQMEVGESILKKALVDIKEIVETALADVKDEAEKKKVQFYLNLPQEVEERTLNMDSGKIKEAIWNIIDNAVKYNKEGGSVTVTGERVSHPIEKQKKIFRLIIADTGMGISPEEMPKLFSMYFERGKAGEELNIIGRGIGLVVTRNIVQAHGGKIWAESDGDNKGARFIIELPA